jgi:hypothetical protein
MKLWVMRMNERMQTKRMKKRTSTKIQVTTVTSLMRTLERMMKMMTTNGVLGGNNVAAWHICDTANFLKYNLFIPEILDIYVSRGRPPHRKIFRPLTLLDPVYVITLTPIWILDEKSGLRL